MYPRISPEERRMLTRSQRARESAMRVGVRFGAGPGQGVPDLEESAPYYEVSEYDRAVFEQAAADMQDGDAIKAESARRAWNNSINAVGGAFLDSLMLIPLLGHAYLYIGGKLWEWFMETGEPGEGTSPIGKGFFTEAEYGDHCPSGMTMITNVQEVPEQIGSGYKVTLTTRYIPVDWYRDDLPGGLYQFIMHWPEYGIGDKPLSSPTSSEVYPPFVNTSLPTTEPPNDQYTGTRIITWHGEAGQWVYIYDNCPPNTINYVHEIGTGSEDFSLPDITDAMPVADFPGSDLGDIPEIPLEDMCDMIDCLKDPTCSDNWFDDYGPDPSDFSDPGTGIPDDGVPVDPGTGLPEGPLPEQPPDVGGNPGTGEPILPGDLVPELPPGVGDTGPIADPADIPISDVPGLDTPALDDLDMGELDPELGGCFGFSGEPSGFKDKNQPGGISKRHQPGANMTIDTGGGTFSVGRGQISSEVWDCLKGGLEYGWVEKNGRLQAPSNHPDGCKLFDRTDEAYCIDPLVAMGWSNDGQPTSRVCPPASWRTGGKRYPDKINRVKRKKKKKPHGGGHGGGGQVQGETEICVDPLIPPDVGLDEKTCYQWVVTDAIQSVLVEMGVPSENVLFDSECDKVLFEPICFAKGTSLKLILDYLLSLCGFCVFPQIDGNVIVGTCGPVDVHWTYHEDVDLIAFDLEYDNLEAYAYVEVFRPDRYSRAGTIIEPGYSILYPVASPIAVDPNRIYQQEVPLGYPEPDALDMAVSLAQKFQYNALPLIGFAVPLNSDLRLRHQLHIKIPSDDFNAVYMVTKLANDYDRPNGHLNKGLARWLRNGE